ncbi:protein of unknown function [Candidatus Nitrospira inopinata]|uniref:Uncharacterized protein n=1 Tax=Candidatus Nitrospira inopinata TaxID=1715989 RepID=A0A0S4L1M1_9BACT|nr:protein of unknown function [Candidatus Nitrospira inopinata]
MIHPFRLRLVNFCYTQHSNPLQCHS